MTYLGEIFTIRKGRKEVKSFENTSLRYIQIDDLRNNDYLKYCVKNLKNVLCDPSDILIAWDGANAGTIGYGLKGAIGSTIAKLSTERKDVFIPYVGKFLQSKLKYLRERCTGATIPHISRNELDKIKIPLPPLETQKKIAAILDKADELRRNDQKILEKYNQLTQSVFLEMFGDPVTNPKGWNICKLKNVCKKITDGTHYPPKFVSKGIPFLFISNIVNNKIEFNTEKYITDQEYIELYKRTPIENGDILYTTVGSYGNPAIVNSEKKFMFQRHIGYLKPDHKKINYKYLFGALLNEGTKRQVDRLVRGIAQKTLNLKDLKEVIILLPPVELQTQYAQNFEKIEQQKLLTQQSLEKSEELFQSLLQKAFGPARNN